MTDNSNEDEQEYSRWKRDATVAAGAGLGATVLMGLGTFAVGRVGGNEARLLLDAMLPTSRFLASSVMTASATILALMLTVLGMTVKTDVKLEKTFFHRIRQIAFYDMLLLITAISFLVLHCIPITKSDKLPDWWYPTVYYSLLAVSAIIGGAMVSVVAMLYATLRDLIQLMGINPKQND